MNPILNLPRDLRDEIYSHMFPKTAIHFRRGLSSYPVLQVCRGLRSDVLYNYLESHSFSVSTPAELRLLCDSLNKANLSDSSMEFPKHICLLMFRGIIPPKGDDWISCYTASALCQGYVGTEAEKETQEWMNEIRKLPLNLVQHVTIDTAAPEKVRQQLDYIAPKIYRRVDLFLRMKSGGRIKVNRRDMREGEEILDDTWPKLPSRATG